MLFDVYHNASSGDCILMHASHQFGDWHLLTVHTSSMAVGSWQHVADPQHTYSRPPPWQREGVLHSAT